MDSIYKEFPSEFFFTWKSFVKFFRIFKLESDFFPHFFCKIKNLENCAHLFILNYNWANFQGNQRTFLVSLSLFTFTFHFHFTDRKVGIFCWKVRKTIRFPVRIFENKNWRISGGTSTEVPAKQQCEDSYNKTTISGESLKKLPAKQQIEIS